MPLEQALKSDLRDRVSRANKFNVDELIAEVEKARATLAEDDKDYARLGGWLEDLAVVKGGKVIGRHGDTV
jgi:ADP-ribose pyrophosphatase YjhB (NUDIX family)